MLLLAYRLLVDVLGYNQHLSPLLSLFMDEFTSLHHTLLTLLPPRSLCDSRSHRVSCLVSWSPIMALLIHDIGLYKIN